MRMPFGKHRGRDLADIPDQYLFWMLDRCENLSPTLADAVRERLGLKPPAPSPDEKLLDELNVLQCAYETVVHDRDCLDQDFRKWYRMASMLLHPDRGGSHEAMVLINELKDVFDRKGGR